MKKEIKIGACNKISSVSTLQQREHFHYSITENHVRYHQPSPGVWASSGESLGGAENRLPTGFGREPGQVGAVGWEAGAPGLILGAGKQGRPAGRKAVAGLQTPGVGGYDAWVEVLNSSSVWRRRVALWFPEQGRALKSQVKETPRWV